MYMIDPVIIIRRGSDLPLEATRRKGCCLFATNPTGLNDSHIITVCSLKSSTFNLTSTVTLTSSTFEISHTYLSSATGEMIDFRQN